MKTCRKCGIPKSLSEFAPDTRNRDGRTAYCHPCAAEKNKTWKVANPGKRKASQHATWLKAKANGTYDAWIAKNRGKRRAQERARYNPEKARIKNAKFRQENSDKMSSLRKRWNAANPEKVKAHNAAGYARRRNAPVRDFTAKEWAFLKELYNHCCAYCGKPSEALSKDHVIPLTRGGNHTLTNILVCCKSCNSKKNDDKFIVPLLLRCADGIARPVHAHPFLAED